MAYLVPIKWDPEYPGGAFFECPACKSSDTDYREPVYRCWSCDWQTVDSATQD